MIEEEDMGQRDCGQSGQTCKGISAQERPCWEASEKSRACRNEVCRECMVYRMLSRRADIKSLVCQYEVLEN